MADEFENCYGETPFWIELKENTSAKLPGMYRQEVKKHPNPKKSGRKIIPIPVEYMKNPKKVAEKVHKIAWDTMY